MDKSIKNQPSIWQITKSLQKKSKQYSFWQDARVAESIQDIAHLKISLIVLKKHVPKHYHPLIRLTRQRQMWIISVQSTVTASRLKMMLDEISMRIAKDIGYAPRLKINTCPTNWTYSGVCLEENKPRSKVKTPTPEEAKETIKNFIYSRDHKD